jgi:hypothetical protein
MNDVKRKVWIEGTDVKEDMWATDVLLIEEVGRMIMGGGYTNEIAWDVIKLVRKNDKENPHVVG